MTLRYSITPEERRVKFGKVLKEKGFARGIGVHDGLSGLIAQVSEVEGKKFDFVWESSLCDSAVRGMPDIELGGISARIQRIREISGVSSLPMIVDGDTGGEASHFGYDIRTLEDLGVSGVIIEDKAFPKRNSLSGDARQELEDTSVFCEKIRAGKKVQKTREFMIMARTESLIAGIGMQEAIGRAEAYLKAGADGIMIHSKNPEPGEVLMFAGEYNELCKRLGYRKPLVCVPTTYNTITEEELRKKGFNVVIHANQMLRAAYRAMQETAEEILANGRSFEVEPRIAKVRDIFRVVGFDDVVKNDAERDTTPSAIILSAGKHNIGKNPSLIEIAGKKVLEHQIEALRKCGIRDINVVIGYEREKFPKLDGVHYITNNAYEERGILHSLMCAEMYMGKGFVYLNGDVLVDERLLRGVMDAQGDIVLAVDDSYKHHKHGQQKRLDAVVVSRRAGEGVRQLRVGNEKILKIGKQIPPKEMSHEFVGLARFSRDGARNMLKAHTDCAERLGVFYEAEGIGMASDTDMWQEMIDRGFVFTPYETRAGWLEIHNEQDIRYAEEMFGRKD
jgi:phosphoenolpyruvate phosphomutase